MLTLSPVRITDFQRATLTLAFKEWRNAVSTCTVKVKVKGKVPPRKGHEGTVGEQMISSTLSLTSALDGVGG